jgi:putative membrane protein
MALFSETDRQRIASAIARAEQDTAGEIVCVVARQAGDYAFVPVVWAALGALALPWPLLRWTLWSAETVYLIQLATFLVLVVGLWLVPVRHWLVPPSFKRRRARQAARQQFYAQSVFRTAGQTGCLIYVAEAERYAEVDDRPGDCGKSRAGGVAPDHRGADRCA